MLWMCLYFPDLSVELFSRGCQENKPRITCDVSKGRELVYASNAIAKQIGVQNGMRLSNAYALAASLQVHRRDEVAEQAALKRLGLWAKQYTSYVSLAESNAILLEVQGSLKLFGGAVALQKKILNEMDELGYRIQFAVAPTPGAAKVLAKADKAVWIERQEALASHLGSLPLAYFGFSDKILQSLSGLGLRCFRDCLRLPRAGLLRRFGKSFLTDLDRLIGSIPDPQKKLASPPRFESSILLPAETKNVEALLFVARRLLSELQGFLFGASSNAQQLLWILDHERDACTKFVIESYRPVRDVSRLIHLLQNRLERLVVCAPVISVGLLVEKIYTVEEQNAQLWGNADQEEQWERMVERLKARIGSDAVKGICVIGDHRPERAWNVCEPGERTMISSAAKKRPLWLLPQAVCIQEQKGQLYWRGVLTVISGPERIENGWWDNDVRRDYFVVENELGERFWVYRDYRQDAQWYLHGVFA